MKRVIVFVSFVIIVLLCLGCVSQNKYDLLKTENDALKTENEDLQTQVDHLEYMVEVLSTPDPAEAPPIETTKALSDIVVTVFEPNSADGVDVKIAVNNLSNRTIKYISYIVTPYNAVGDEVRCEISNKSKLKLKLTGPGEPNTKMYGTWENIWYNPTVDTCVLSEIYIEYTDGSTIDIPKSTLDEIGIEYKQAESKY